MDKPGNLECPLRTESDVVSARQSVRRVASEMKFSLVDQTKLVTAASEIARNAVVYAGGGTLRIEPIEDRGRRGLRLVVEDQGPGIEDVELALRDGYTSGKGLGLGLGGARRLSNDFHLETWPGRGTRITLTRWR